MTEAELKKILNEELAKAVGQISQNTASRVDAVRDELKSDINRVYELVDGLAQRLETDEQERAAITGELDRHQGWISQLANTTNTKLVPEP